MKLLDHFRPPLSGRRHWESFHARWASSIADALNKNLLPRDYFAEVQVHVGSRVEVDIATFGDGMVAEDGHTAGGTATAESYTAGDTATATAALETRAWSPPMAALVMPAIFPDSLEVLVISTQAGPTLVAAVELVSPGNKDRPETRRAFAAKCAAYLQQGIGLAVVDIVTSLEANLHNELVSLLGVGERFLLPSGSLYAVSYHPRRRPTADEIEVWPVSLGLDEDLPVVPLPLDKGLFVPLDLGSTYTEACEHSRLP